MTNDDSLRPIQAAESAGKAALDRARGAVLSWLPDRFRCDACGEYCEPRTEYVATQAAIMDVWACESCDARYFREDGDPLHAEMWDR